MAQGADQHEIISQLKALASDLGRSPRMSDLDGSSLSRHRVIKAFGSFVIAMQAAGLPVSQSQAKRKVDPALFHVELLPHLDQEHTRQASPRPSNFILPCEDYPATAILGDFHAPFQHAGATEFAISVIQQLQPKRVIQMGDLRDMFSATKFPRSHNLFTPREEIESGSQACARLWEQVRQAVPKAECYQLWGNHDLRPYKRVLEACPELEMFIDLTPLYTFPGVRLQSDPRQELELDGVFFHHGYRTKLGDNRDFLNACSVTGHSHKGGAVFRAIHGGHQIWELNAGTLGDPEAKGLTYTPQRHTHQTLGLGFIDHLGPRFIPYRPKR